MTRRCQADDDERQDRCPRRHHARGLCELHYRRWYRLETTTRETYRAEELVAEWEFLRTYDGLTRRQAAERLGIKLSRLEKAIERYRQRSTADVRQRSELARDAAPLGLAVEEEAT